jgi:hypothetical protein
MLTRCVFAADATAEVAFRKHVIHSPLSATTTDSFLEQSAKGTVHSLCAAKTLRDIGIEDDRNYVPWKAPGIGVFSSVAKIVLRENLVWI